MGRNDYQHIMTMQTKQMTAEISIYKDFIKKYIDLDDDDLETENPNG